jgi:hypothetical protein
VHERFRDWSQAPVDALPDDVIVSHPLVSLSLSFSLCPSISVPLSSLLTSETEVIETSLIARPSTMSRVSGVTIETEIGHTKSWISPTADEVITELTTRTGLRQSRRYTSKRVIALEALVWCEASEISPSLAFARRGKARETLVVVADAGLSITDTVRGITLCEERESKTLSTSLFFSILYLFSLPSPLCTYQRSSLSDHRAYILR